MIMIETGTISLTRYKGITMYEILIYPKDPDNEDPAKSDEVLDFIGVIEWDSLLYNRITVSDINISELRRLAIENNVVISVNKLDTILDLFNDDI